MLTWLQSCGTSAPRVLMVVARPGDEAAMVEALSCHDALGVVRVTGAGRRPLFDTGTETAPLGVRDLGIQPASLGKSLDDAAERIAAMVQLLHPDIVITHDSGGDGSIQSLVAGAVEGALAMMPRRGVVTPALIREGEIRSAAAA